jgi:DNA polymerase III alpha subunit
MKAYIELHCHSYYSLLDGASSPAALVEQAAHLGMSALALTDHDNLYGAVVVRQAPPTAMYKQQRNHRRKRKQENNLL